MKQFVLIYLNNLSYDNIIQLLKACVYNDIVLIKYVCVLIVYLVEIILYRSSITNVRACYHHCIATFIYISIFNIIYLVSGLDKHIYTFLKGCFYQVCSIT